jgi:hypothetical protein
MSSFKHHYVEIAMTVFGVGIIYYIYSRHIALLSLERNEPSINLKSMPPRLFNPLGIIISGLNETLRHPDLHDFSGSER